jgi:Secretion system C-terminal sorting domain
MKKLLSIILLIVINTFGFAQSNTNANVSIIQPIPVCTIGQCVDLIADYNPGKATDLYSVSSIPYSQYPYLGGIQFPNHPNGFNDDYWSPAIILPFAFSFYGNCYNQISIGSNGLITFDTTNNTAFSICPYTFNQTIPSSTFPVKNAIYGVYQDLNLNNLAIGQNINYYVSGTAPNRVFVINFNEIPQYLNQVTDFQTSQIILHETTNSIDINVKKRTSLIAWNSGNGVIGIQNLAGTNGISPPGRNTGNWSATNESWRFTPNGTTNSQLSWKKNGVLINSSQNPLNVCPTSASDSYRACVTYLGCNGTNTVVESLPVSPFVQEPQFGIPSNINGCANLPDITFESVNLTINEPIILNSLDLLNFEISYYTTLANAVVGANPIANPINYIVYQNPEIIYVAIENVVTGCRYTKSFQASIYYVYAPSGSSNQNFTQGQTLQNLVVAGTNITWYQNSLIGIPLESNTILVDGTTYYASQTNIYGCQSPQRLPVTVHLTLANDTFLSENLKISPNPVNDIFTVSYSESLKSIDVYNAIGQKIITKKVSEKETKIDLTTYNSGIYFVKVFTETGNKTIKIIKN